MTSAWKPADNYLLVSVPERFTRLHTPGQKRLVLPSGSDDWQALDAQLRAGTSAEIETDDAPVAVCQGQVLAVPKHLTADMVLCAGLGTKLVPRYRVINDPKGKPVKNPDGSRAMCTDGYMHQSTPRTAADITERVAVGDTIHFDPSALTDESEVAPGVYLVGYSDVIATLKFAPLPHEGQKDFDIRALGNTYHVNAEMLCRGRAFYETLKTGAPNPYAEPRRPASITPIAGYVLLTRIWADDVADEPGEQGLVKCRKNKDGLVLETAVPPLPNEGIVAWHSAPLCDTRQEAQVGDRVVIDGRMARVETIGGVECLAVRQDFILAIRPMAPKLTADQIADILAGQPT